MKDFDKFTSEIGKSSSFELSPPVVIHMNHEGLIHTSFHPVLIFLSQTKVSRHTMKSHVERSGRENQYGRVIVTSTMK